MKQQPRTRSDDRADIGNSDKPTAVMSNTTMIIGSIALTTCSAMALFLALEQLGRMHLPGCGVGSACAAVAAGPWGKIPGINWPVSFVGLAFYAALGVAWSASRSGTSLPLRLLVRSGGLASLGFLAIMLTERQLCPYCLTAHLAFFVFCFVCERVTRARTASLRPLLAAIPMFALVTLALLPIELMERGAARERAEEALAASTAQMVAAPRTRAGFSEVIGGGTGVPILPSVTLRSAQSDNAGDASLARGLTGRHRIGPELSPIRIVIFSDYQCKDCQRIESEVRALAAQRDDISLAARHFPMCSDCNRHVPRNMHPNACWAARAAEAAAILDGTDGFWRMHHWLFDRGGGFTDRELSDALPRLGFDPQEFVRVLQSPQTLEPVQEDIELAVELGLHFTPMIFVNGVELRGWNAPHAVTRAVTALAASHPPAMSAAADRPPRALAKYIDDWQRQPAIALTDETDHALGSDGASVDVVLFGDYREPNCVEADRLIRALVARSPHVRYHYRHYPVNTECNPGVSFTRYPLACLAAEAAEAAGELGGDDGFWKMHIWLFENQTSFSEAALRDAAAAMGFAPTAFDQALQSDGAKSAIADDTRAGRRRFRGIPAIFVNGKYVPRWRRDGQSILEQIVTQAAKPPSRSGRGATPAGPRTGRAP